MKKTISLILMLLLCLSLGGCFEEPLIIEVFDEPCLNSARAGEIFERYELTAENWREYLKAYTYQVETVKKDAFGEIVERETVKVTMLGCGTERYYGLSGALELKHKQTGELVTYRFYGQPVFLDENFNLDDYECSRIQGYVYFANIPEELIIKSETRSGYRNENAHINIGSSGGGVSFTTTLDFDTDSKFIDIGSHTLDRYFE